jgi:hypothetical protein
MLPFCELQGRQEWKLGQWNCRVMVVLIYLEESQRRGERSSATGTYQRTPELVSELKRG